MRAAAFVGLATLIAVPACSRQSTPSFSMPTSARLHVDTGFVGINGGELYYESAGAGPQVVLLHGGNLDSRMWDSQFEILARQHRVVRYDARGFGRSSAASVPYAAHEDLLSLLDTFHIERASLVGLSLGGRIAIDFALAHPSRVDRLVLASPGLSGWSFARGDTSWGANWRLARARDDSVGMATAWLASAYMKPAMERVELQTPLRDLIRASAGYWMGLVRHGDTEAASEPPALGRTGLVHAPTLLIVGSRDVPDILHIADTLAATIAHVHKVVIPGVGHMVNLEASAQFNSLLLDFLR